VVRSYAKHGKAPVAEAAAFILAGRKLYVREYVAVAVLSL
jgi:hypothetical protein